MSEIRSDDIPEGFGVIVIFEFDVEANFSNDFDFGFLIRLMINCSEDILRLLISLPNDF
jgi:hypothetical protein